MTLDANAVIWLMVAIVNAVPATVAAVFAVRAHNAAVRSEKLTRQVEIATNSMKDALVKSTGDAARAEGRETGRAEGEVKASLLAEGRLGAQTDLG